MLNLLKGWLGEQITTFGMWLALDESIYRRIDDLILQSKNGTTQIDHILVSKFGIFVIETKNMKGWIFGNEHDATWRQSIYGYKSSFQNPLRQNYRHIECLADFLTLDRRLFHSIIFFIGECQFKTDLPKNVLSAGLKKHLTSYTTPILTDDQVQQIETKLRDYKQTSTLTKRDHLRSLEKRHTSTDTCPKCGAAMVPRTAKSSGQQFLGCSNFPKCRHTVWPKSG